MPNKHPAVFVDRDNTLIHDPGYLRHAEHVRLLSGVGEAVAKLRNAGFPVIVVSNQSGIARGYLTEAELATVHQRMQELLQANGSGVDAIYYCPFLTGPEAVVDQYRKDSDLRKPKPGMLVQAAADLNLDLANSWMIGDSDRDVQAGQAVGCKTILIGNGNIDVDIQPDFTSAGFAKAAEIVLRETKGKTPPKPAAPSQSNTQSSASSAPAKHQSASKPKSEMSAGGGTAVATAPATRVADQHVRILDSSAAAVHRNVVDPAAPKPVAKQPPAPIRPIEVPVVESPKVEKKPDPAPTSQKELSLPTETAAADPIIRHEKSPEAPKVIQPISRQPDIRKTTVESTSPNAHAEVAPPKTSLEPAPGQTRSFTNMIADTFADRKSETQTSPRPESGSTAADQSTPSASSPQFPHNDLPITRAPEPTLGQVLEELRMLRREKNSSDFSFAQLAGAIVQAFAICALAFGLYAAVNGDMPAATFRVQLAAAFQLMALTGFILSRKP